MADDQTPVVDAAVDPEPVADPPTDPVDEWTPPTREEFEALQQSVKERDEKLRKAYAEANGKKKQLVELQKKHEDDDTRAKREATEAALAAMKPVAIKAEAKSAFLEAGADAAKVARLTRLLDLSTIDIDGDTVTGLDVQVTELKADFPELFAKAPADGEKPKPVAKVNTTPARPAPKGEQSPGEKVMAALLGRR